MSSAHGVTSGKAGSGGTDRTALEMLAVLLLGIGSVATAWCGIQAARWNGEEARESRDGAIIRIEASESHADATQLFEYDLNMVSQYARAYADGDDEFRAFLRQNLVRPKFLPVLDMWEAAIEAGDAPTNLFADEEYIDSLFAESTAAAAESKASLTRSDDASNNGDGYLLLTLLTATALFFAGVTTSFASRNARLVLISVSAIIITATAARLIDLPVV